MNIKKATALIREDNLRSLTTEVRERRTYLKETAKHIRRHTTCPRERGKKHIYIPFRV